jgi:hypothetical protein
VSPLVLVNGNVRGAGKSLICRLLSIIANGTDGILMAWPAAGGYGNLDDEVRKRLASLLHEAAPLVVIDNLPGGRDFASDSLNAFLTSTEFYDRKLHHNDGQRVGGRNKLTLLATGNAVQPSGDCSDRVLTIQLRSPHENPRSLPPTSFKYPNLLEHVKANRAQLLGAALTILRGWILDGRKQPPGESWGSFGRWTDTVAAAVRWATGVDPLEDRAGQVAATDSEKSALVCLVSNWDEVINFDPGTLSPDFGPKTAGAVLEHLSLATGEVAEGFKDAIAKLGNVPKWPPSSQKVAAVLATFIDRPVVVERGEKKVRLSLKRSWDQHHKMWGYRVEETPYTEPGVYKS